MIIYSVEFKLLLTNQQKKIKENQKIYFGKQVLKKIILNWKRLHLKIEKINSDYQKLIEIIIKGTIVDCCLIKWE